jgi:hypothetical protein
MRLGLGAANGERARGAAERATGSDRAAGPAGKKTEEGRRALEGRRKGEGGADVWGRCAGERERKRDALGLRTGRAGPGVAHAGRRRKRRGEWEWAAGEKKAGL